MKSFALKIAVLGTLGLTSTYVSAGWENLPAAGVPVSGGTSPYILCNPTGNFGSGLPVQPSPGSNDKCAVFPTTETTVPDSSYTGLSAIPVKSTVRDVTINGQIIGNVRELIWRKSTGGGSYQCIYATKVNLFGVDYLPSVSGNQYFEVNDIERRGWGNKTLDIAYSTVPAVAEPTYRAGRSDTSVQHRPETGYVAQPLANSGAPIPINGVNTWPTPSGHPTSAEQEARLTPDSVDFTTDVNYLDDDGSTSASSGMYYVRTSCSSGDFSEADDAISLRQTFQELSGDGVTPNSFTAIPVRGYLPN